MEMENWLIKFRCLTGIGAALLISGTALAGESTQIPHELTPEAVFSQTVHNTHSVNSGCAPACDANGCSPSGCDAAVGALSNSGCDGCDLSNSGCDGCSDSCGWCNLGEEYRLIGTMDRGIDVGGWFQFGYHNKRNGLFNNHPNAFNLHQGWIYAEKLADGSCGLDWGFRVDAMYGVDGADTQAFGNDPGEWDFRNGFDHGRYGWAIPQLYAEIASGDWNLKVGHFFTLVGYEVVPATGNFFYSHAYTMYNSEPFTHTGALVSYNASDSLTVYGGWTLGWDTGFDQMSNGNIFIGGFSKSLGDNVTATYITTIGDFGARSDEGYSHSFVVDVAVTDKLNYIFQTDAVFEDAYVAAMSGAGPTFDNEQYGINQYLIYTINDCLAAGTRVEWWKNDSDSQYAATFGVNVRPHANLLFRPEIRHDWNPNARNNFTTFGVDMILTY